MIERLIDNLSYSLDGMFSYMTPRLWMLGVVLPFFLAMCYGPCSPFDRENGRQPQYV